VPQALRALSAGDAHLDALLHKAARLAPQRLPVMIQGETGAGKEYLARALHAASGRPGPFVAINCAAIPETLLESELFGYLPGTYTGGASRGKTGLVEAAHRGTLFLDEIGDMPLHLQAKLLRVLSESEITPLGARQPKPLDLRVISATHRPLAVLVDQGLFRQDLLFRLNAAQLSLPPLRQRQDLDALIDRLAEAQRPGLRPTPEARALLRAHGWPGNLRELHNALCHAAALSEGPCFGPEHLPETVLEASAGSPQTAATMLLACRRRHWSRPRTSARPAILGILLVPRTRDGAGAAAAALPGQCVGSGPPAGRQPLHHPPPHPAAGAGRAAGALVPADGRD
jgi:transcriptional regulator with PAS, ATPase and Fis domain